MLKERMGSAGEGMMKFKRRIARALALHSSLGRSLAIFMVGLLIAGMATSFWTLSRAWDREVEDTERDAINLSVAQARQAEDTFLQTEVVLRDIRRSLPPDNITGIDVKQFDSYLNELKERLPQLHGLMVYDVKGEMLATSFGKIPLL